MRGVRTPLSSLCYTLVPLDSLSGAGMKLKCWSLLLMGEKGNAVCFVIFYVPMSYLVYRKVKQGWKLEL